MVYRGKMNKEIVIVQVLLDLTVAGCYADSLALQMILKSVNVGGGNPISQLCLCLSTGGRCPISVGKPFSCKLTSHSL